MKSMAGVLPGIPLFKLYRQFGWPRMLPLRLPPGDDLSAS
jgi:hypothetical protein